MIDDQPVDVVSKTRCTILENPIPHVPNTHPCTQTHCSCRCSGRNKKLGSVMGKNLCITVQKYLARLESTLPYKKLFNCHSPLYAYKKEHAS